MRPEALRALLCSVANGELSPERAYEALQILPLQELAEAQAALDTHRPLRTGQPEVVLGSGKRPEQLREIVGALAATEVPVLVTRLSSAKGRALEAAFPDGTFDPLSRTFLLGEEAVPEPKGRPVVVVGAGSSDAPVVAEAAVTARVLGARVEQVHDVGVAGIHRLTRHLGTLRSAGVLVVCAGMEGALPSVIAGMTGRPVIAVPTSVGYGASFGGLAALLGMLNSCAAGVCVVNIDNGFGAGQLAARIACEMVEEEADP